MELFLRGAPLSFAMRLHIHTKEESGGGTYTHRRKSGTCRSTPTQRERRATPAITTRASDKIDSKHEKQQGGHLPTHKTQLTDKATVAQVEVGQPAQLPQLGRDSPCDRRGVVARIGTIQGARRSKQKSTRMRAHEGRVSVSDEIDAWGRDETGRDYKRWKRTAGLPPSFG